MIYFCSFFWKGVVSSGTSEPALETFGCEQVEESYYASSLFSKMCVPLWFGGWWISFFSFSVEIRSSSNRDILSNVFGFSFRPVKVYPVYLQRNSHCPRIQTDCCCFINEISKFLIIMNMYRWSNTCKWFFRCLNE